MKHDIQYYYNYKHPNRKQSIEYKKLYATNSSVATGEVVVFSYYKEVDAKNIMYSNYAKLDKVLDNDLGPALIIANMENGEIYEEAYYKDGVLHREDGPAVVSKYPQQSWGTPRLKSWGQKMSGKDTFEGWFINGKRINMHLLDNWLIENNITEMPLTKEQTILLKLQLGEHLITMSSEDQYLALMWGRCVK